MNDKLRLEIIGRITEAEERLDKVAGDSYASLVGEADSDLLAAARVVDARLRREPGSGLISPQEPLVHALIHGLRREGFATIEAWLRERKLKTPARFAKLAGALGETISEAHIATTKATKGEE